MKFSNREYADIVLYYGMACCNATVARRMYAEAFPQRRIPNERVFPGTYNRLAETGNVSKPAGDRIRGHDENVEESVLLAVEEDPTTSVRQLSRRLGVQRNRVHRVLKNNRMHPYHYQPVQELHEGDSQRRLDFCRFMVEKDEDFFKCILWSDESTFDREGIVNFHNLHHYATENPHVKMQTKHQRRFSCNVWAGIIGK